MFVRTSDAAGTAKALRAEIARLDPTMFVDVQPMTDAVGAALVPAQVGAALTSGFGALGALLAMMGIYGLVAFTVAQRTREIGIRKAVGATTSDIVRLVISGSAVPVGDRTRPRPRPGRPRRVRARRLHRRRLARRSADDCGNDRAGSSEPPSRRARVPALRAARVDPLRALKTE